MAGAQDRFGAGGQEKARRPIQLVLTALEEALLWLLASCVKAWRHIRRVAQVGQAFIAVVVRGKWLTGTKFFFQAQQALMREQELEGRCNELERREERERKERERLAELSANAVDKRDEATARAERAEEALRGAEMRYQSELSQEREKATSLQSALRDASERADALHRELSAERDVREREQSAREHAESERAELAARMEALSPAGTEDELARTQEEVARLQAEAKAAHEERQAQEEAAKGQHEKRQDAEARAVQAEENAAEEARRARAAEERLSEEEHAREVAQNKADNSEQETEALRQEVESERAGRAEADAGRRAAESRLEEASRQLEATRERLAVVEEGARAREEHEEERRRLEECVRAAARRAEAAEARVDEVESAEGEVAELAAEAVAGAVAREEAEVALGDEMASRERSEATLQALRREYGALEQRLFDERPFKQPLAEEEGESAQEGREEGPETLGEELRLVKGERDRLRGECERLRGELWGRPTADKVEVLERRLSEEESERKRLHNLLQEAKGSIRVLARIRCPGVAAGEGEEEACARPAVVAASKQKLRVEEGLQAGAEFPVDRAFGPEANEAEVFAEVEPFVQSFLDGYNGALLAYGQTGSGKTHTVSHIGSRAARLAAEKAREQGASLEVAVSEVYNEQERDLLGGREAVDSGPKAEEALARGLANRRTAETASNDRSSRSHCVAEMFCRGSRRSDAESKLVLVDLAGSERLGKQDAGATARKAETKHINKSLSALCDVITALRKREPHIPFRNSRLTKRLSDCLVGSAKVAVVVTLSPLPPSLPESLSSLQFASRVGRVSFGPLAPVASNPQPQESRLP